MVSCQKERDGVPFWPNIRPEVAWPPGTKSRKFRWAEKILGVEYRSASIFGTHRDKCFVGWNCAFLTLRQNGRQVYPPTFRDKQENLCALRFIFCRLPTNWHYWVHGARCVKCFWQTSICREKTKNQGQGISSFLFGSKSCWKHVASLGAFRQKCAISSDETFVSMSPWVRGWTVLYT